MPVFKKEICSAVLFEEAVCIRKRYRFSESHSRCSESGTGGSRRGWVDERRRWGMNQRRRRECVIRLSGRSDEAGCRCVLSAFSQFQRSTQTENLRPLRVRTANSPFRSVDTDRYCLFGSSLGGMTQFSHGSAASASFAFSLSRWSQYVVLHCSGVTQPLLTVTIVTLR